MVSLLDKTLVDGWLRRNRDTLKFSDCLSMMGEVVCDVIPNELREILLTFDELQPKKIFSRLYDKHVKQMASNPGELIDLLAVYEKASKKYKEDMERLNSGKHINSCFHHSYQGGARLANLRVGAIA